MWKLSNNSIDRFKKRQMLNSFMETILLNKFEKKVPDDELVQLKMSLEDIKAGRIKRVR